ncbi:MAG: GTPase ObgE [Bdellovibrionaceae bacterium]|nr:GTPase ObgE [Bdellovibrionales bacterium]MCB9085514.1 GTPase ObgE [Pseudobdellovibrionaceae bacterium]
MKFIDEVTLAVASGKGGPGCVSFRRESMVPRGGPDGGHGGKGGDVLVRVNPHLNSLLDLHNLKRLSAENGQPGMAEKMDGRAGKDLVIDVPAGTVVTDESGNVLVDMGEVQETVLLEGGLGGKGNTFYKTSVNQAPGIAQKGMPGEELVIHLELKLIADVGIIGFPNAGKSTIISVISAAKPKIADYPFTTLVPNLGVVRYGDADSFVAADIPGLIVGAHKGVGLGSQFLRHIERTRVFVHVVDASEMSQRDPVQDYKDINEELKLYDEMHQSKEGYWPLSDRPQVVVLNKMDVVPEEREHQLVEEFRRMGVTALPVSAATRKNIKELIFAAGSHVIKGDQSE